MITMVEEIQSTKEVIGRLETELKHLKKQRKLFPRMTREDFDQRVAFLSLAIRAWKSHVEMMRNIRYVETNPKTGKERLRRLAVS